MSVMTQAAPQRFVIIASQRTGSNMLVSALNSHPDVVCHGELLRKNKKHFKGAVKIITLLDERYHDENYQMNHWRDYIDAVVEASGQVDAIGFKIMLNQHDEARHALIADPGYKKILLKRENVLSVYSSNKVARETGQGVAGRFAEVKIAQVAFVAKGFERYCAKYEERYQGAEDELQASGQRFHRTTYADICNPEGIGNVLKFIGADRSLPWEAKTKKRNSSVLTDRFSNPEAVVEYMNRTGKSHWLQE